MGTVSADPGGVAKVDIHHEISLPLPHLFESLSGV